MSHINDKHNSYISCVIMCDTTCSVYSIALHFELTIDIEFFYPYQVMCLPSVPLPQTGATPLIIAALKGNADVVNLLLQHRASVNTRDKVC